MISILLAGAISGGIALFGTPIAIRFLRTRQWGQVIREDGPQAHFVKHGTPTMGGLVIIAGAAVGYVLAHLRPSEIRPFTAAGLCAIGAVVAMGSLGFVDDYLKVTRRRSLGLNKTGKLIGQLFIALVFAWVADKFTGTSSEVSFARPLGIDLGLLFFLWVYVIFAASANGVNLTDGLDGLAPGSGAGVMAAYVVIAFWQSRHLCEVLSGAGCYLGVLAESQDLAMAAAGMVGAASGFLWWNAAPAKIFMGDTGAMALGGGMAAFAVLTNTQLLLIVLGGLYVVEVTSVILQVISFRIFGKRAFLMAPVHHHFELQGWPEFTVIVRFWILAGMSIGLGLGLFYADFIARGGVG